MAFEIESGSTLDQPRLRDVAAQIEQVIARLAKAKFLYLDWVPSSTSDPPGAPRLVLELVDGPRGACDPPAVRAKFRAEKGDAEAWSYPELEVTELCDLGAPELTGAQLIARVEQLTQHVLDDASKMKQLEDDFLSGVVIATELTPDFTIKKLYLPLGGLKAKPESRIEVRFANRDDRVLFAHPGNVEGGRTQLFIGSFRCEDQVDSGAAAAVPRQAWHPLLQQMLELCREPFVYMIEYRPDPLEVELGVVTDFDDGGTP